MKKIEIFKIYSGFIYSLFFVYNKEISVPFNVGEPLEDLDSTIVEARFMINSHINNFEYENSR